MTRRTTTRRPVIGSAFDQDQTNDAGRIQNYIDELRYYRPRGSAALAKEGEAILERMEADEPGAGDGEWMNEADELLTAWAQKIERNDYLIFGPFEHTGSVGFYYAAESARDDADLIVSDLSEVPTGFSGLLVEINDHGNMTASNYARGRKTRELFAVV